MRSKTLNSESIFLAFFICFLSIMLNGCSEEKYPVMPMPIHAIRFTDNVDFKYLSPEEIQVDSQEQEISLRIKSISIRPDSYITDRPDQLMFKATNLSESISDDFYKVREVKENGESVIKVSLKTNDTNRLRSISISIYCNLPKIENDLYGLVTIIQDPIKEDKQPLSLKIKYKGSYYISDVFIDDNGEYVYLDNEFNSVMNKINADTSIQMLIMENGSVNYYDSNDINNNLPYFDILSLQPMEYASSLTRANNGFENYNFDDLGYFGIFEHENFTGQNITKSFKTFDFTYNLPQLKNLNMNDKISSIALAYNGKNPIVCSVLTIWDDHDFNYGDENRSKHRISIVASINNPLTSISNLKTIKKINSSKSWNDCISSCSFHFGYADRLLKDY